MGFAHRRRERRRGRTMQQPSGRRPKVTSKMWLLQVLQQQPCNAFMNLILHEAYTVLQVDGIFMSLVVTPLYARQLLTGEKACPIA